MSKWYLIPQDNDLMHYGTKGMKWRYRKTPQTGAYVGDKASNTTLAKKNPMTGLTRHKINGNMADMSSKKEKNKPLTKNDINYALMHWPKLNQKQRVTFLATLKKKNPPAYQGFIKKVTSKNYKSKKYLW